MILNGVPARHAIVDAPCRRAMNSGGSNRSHEKGPRSALMRKRPAAAAGIILPEPWDIRGRVIVHAGRPWAAAGTAFGAPLETRREDVHAVAVGAPGNGAGTQNGTS
jgi:hypothetical protein